MGIENLRCILRFLHTLDSLNFDKNAGGLMRTGKFGENLMNFDMIFERIRLGNSVWMAELGLP